jgi:heptosyltransferase-2
VIERLNDQAITARLRRRNTAPHAAGIIGRKRCALSAGLANGCGHREQEQMSGLISTDGASGKLLIIQPLVGIGDMIWHKPWIDYLCGKNSVVLATKPTVQAPVLFAATKGLVDILPIERSQRGKRGRHDGWQGFWRLVADFRSTGAERALILHHSPRYALAAWFAGIPSRWGYGIRRQRLWLNKGQFLDKTARKMHPIAKMQRYAGLNDFAIDPVWRINVTQPASKAADEFIAKQGINAASDMLILGIGAMDEERCWPLEKFAELIILLAARRPQMICCLMGAPSEQPLVDQILDRLPPHIKAVNAITKLDLGIALLARAAGFVGNDSGLLNLAAACGRPALGIYAQSRPLDYTPNLHAVAVDKSRLGKSGQIKTIAAADVCTAALNMLDSAPAPSVSA